MPISDKFWEELLRWSIPVYVIVLSIWAGTVSTIRRVRKGEIPFFSLREWVGDVSISGFIGVITFFLCKYAGINEYLAAFFISISAHMGARAIAIFEKLWIEKLAQVTGVTLDRELGINTSTCSQDSKHFTTLDEDDLREDYERPKRKGDREDDFSHKEI